jgi:hypothetical protein
MEVHETARAAPEKRLVAYLAVPILSDPRVRLPPIALIVRPVAATLILDEELSVHARNASSAFRDRSKALRDALGQAKGRTRIV